MRLYDSDTLSTFGEPRFYCLFVLGRIKACGLFGADALQCLRERNQKYFRLGETEIVQADASSLSPTLIKLFQIRTACHKRYLGENLGHKIITV